MEVTSKAKPLSKEIAVTLTDADMADVDGWNELPYGERFKKMSDRADALLVQYMLRRGDISPEFAEQRLREIVSGTPAA